LWGFLGRHIFLNADMSFAELVFQCCYLGYSITPELPEVHPLKAISNDIPKAYLVDNADRFDYPEDGFIILDTLVFNLDLGFIGNGFNGAAQYMGYLFREDRYMLFPHDDLFLHIGHQVLVVAL